MAKCDLCEKKGNDLSLLLAHHKELGNIYVCQECWTNLYDKNRMVNSGSGCAPCSSGGPCGSCGR